ncbi:hypothetical protein AK37_19518 [Rhodococcus pyridinivorans AK37]|uniref:Uncharacterized protein n=1 Tax=Rhodococcus pyridinivorans AK37 TaxID=1114960 RepID=H0JW31_9NOCA|nr:hypothetical protein AK37_19518 [Rhodococcus pyridinivorans AK37]
MPLTAAMTGLEMWCLTTPAKPQWAVSGGVTPSGPSVPRASRSAPPQKTAPPAPVSTTTRTSRSSSARSQASPSAWCTSALMLLAALGRLMVTSRTCSRFST